MGCLQAILCRFSLNSWTSRVLCQFDACESTSFKVLVLPNTIHTVLFNHNHCIGNLSALLTSISKISCIVSEIVPCGPAKIYHLWSVHKDFECRWLTCMELTQTPWQIHIKYWFLNAIPDTIYSLPPSPMFTVYTRDITVWDQAALEMNWFPLLPATC